MGEQQVFPWPPGTATGIGSMPGVDPLEAARVVAGELPGFPHLPELPGRGPGADITGRAVALLVEMPAEVTPRGWRIAERPGRDSRRARSYLSADLDALEEVLDGYEGPLKLQVAGPWTLAATLEQPRSLNPALADPGLVADLAASLAEGVAAHVAEVAKRLPRTTIVLQIDEPALPAVIAGTVPTPSGLGRVRVPEEEFLRDRLRQVVTSVSAYSIVHCCSRDYPFGIIRGAGARGLSLDLSQLRTPDYDELAAAAEAGLGLGFGIPERPGGFTRGGTGVRGYPPGKHRGSTPKGSSPREDRAATAKDAADSVAEAWRRMAQPPARCAEQVVVTPACGLAGLSPRRARETLGLLSEAARILPEMMGA